MAMGLHAIGTRRRFAKPLVNKGRRGGHSFTLAPV